MLLSYDIKYHHACPLPDIGLSNVGTCEGSFGMSWPKDMLANSNKQELLNKTILCMKGSLKKWKPCVVGCSSRVGSCTPQGSSGEWSKEHCGHFSVHLCLPGLTREERLASVTTPGSLAKHLNYQTPEGPASLNGISSMTQVVLADGTLPPPKYAWIC